ncbi:MAG: metallophosphoesterase, partial [Cytophagales bacterium]|nr:metallophosphoesterase [Cytophagales bacterium]
VGHTSQSQIVELYDGLVYGVDSSIKNGEYGEFLLIKGDLHYRLTLDGKRIAFD